VTEQAMVQQDDASLMRVNESPGLSKEQILDEVRSSLGEAQKVATKSVIKLWFASPAERKREEVSREALELYQQQIRYEYRWGWG
jgi:hypothetical protein